MLITPPFCLVALTTNGELADRDCFGHASLRSADWFVICDSEAKLASDLPAIVLRAHSDRPDIDLFYGDDLILSADRSAEPMQVLKPRFDKFHLVGQDYIGLPLIVRGDVFREFAPLSAAFGEAFSYDIILRAVAAGFTCERIAKTLSSRNKPMRQSAAGDRRRALESWIERTAPQFALAEGRLNGTFQLQRLFDTYPNVSLLVPTRQSLCKVGSPPELGRPLILNLLESLTKSSWPLDKITVVIGDDATDAGIYEKRSWPFAVKRVATHRGNDEPFNYARKMNTLVREAESDLIVMMNDDLVIRHPDWLEALICFAMESEVGGVGAKLLYPNGNIQHAGMAGGVLGGVTHVFINLPNGAPTYGNWADVHREWSMVTGAVFATRRELVDQIGGMDEKLALEFNDVDLCLRMGALGYKIIYTPYAELTHYESASRFGALRAGDEVAMFLERWKDFLADDPFFHQGFDKSTSNPMPLPARHLTE